METTLTSTTLSTELSLTSLRSLGRESLSLRGWLESSLEGTTKQFHNSHSLHKGNSLP